MARFSFKLKNIALLTHYVEQILRTKFDKVYTNRSYYNFRCNVCGDSVRDKRKRRGYILKGDDGLMFFCHNCGYKTPADKWMKEFFPLEYREYTRELISETTFNKPKVEFEKPVEEFYDEKMDVKFFVPVNSKKCDLCKIALEYCRQRNIPKEIYSKWFVASDGRFKDRLVIPFYDKTGSIYYYQCRSLLGQTPKYLSRKGSDLNSIYNFYNVDYSKPVIIVEGPIDSMFLENAIAITGLKKSFDKIGFIEKKYFIFDFDGPGISQTIEFLKKGYHVFNWAKFSRKFSLSKKDKWDINDVALFIGKDKFTFEELESFFTTNPIDEIELRMELKTGGRS